MGAAAVAAAQAVGYVGAGTVEFILDPSHQFYFMEMNTRLQVEHPVTEAITGLDLVEWQLRVAAGEPLPIPRQEDLHLTGHAIEARICAENPEAGFLPATGPLQVLRWPAHVAFQRGGDTLVAAPVRVDAGVREGDAITPHYDSMIAKLIVWGQDRAQALARLDTALRDTHIVGPATNVAFLRRVVRSQAFATADLDTALIEREHTALFNTAGLALEVAAAGVAAHQLHQESSGEDSDPWSRHDGWRLHGGARRRLDLACDGTHHRFTLARRHDGALRLSLNGEPWPLAWRQLGGERFELLLNGHRHVLSVYACGDAFTVFGEDASLTLTAHDPIAHAGERTAPGGGTLTAPMPGKLVALLAKAGDAVKAGQPLAVMEAMKMEHTLNAPRDGVIGQLLYAVGDPVAEGAELITLTEA
jgi:3-methylcrotonyl-CoA carboxylase alpha subunit